MDMKEELAKDRFFPVVTVDDRLGDITPLEEEALDKLEGDKGQGQVRTVGDKADSELEKMRKDFKKLEADFQKLQREKDISSNRQGGGDRGQGQRYGPHVGSYGQGNGVTETVMGVIGGEIISILLRTMGTATVVLLLTVMPGVVTLLDRVLEREGPVGPQVIRIGGHRGVGTLMGSKVI